MFHITDSFESEPDLVPFFHTLEFLEATHEQEVLVLTVLVRGERIVHLAKKTTMHQYENIDFDVCAS
jgi:hypothetical protein